MSLLLFAAGLPPWHPDFAGDPSSGDGSEQRLTHSMRVTGHADPDTATKIESLKSW
jgi:hypothetical protein